MATATLEEVQTEFRMIELAKITASPMNPRKRFDEKSLAELAASIKTHGVQQPIVVRPKKYAVGVGVKHKDDLMPPPRQTPLPEFEIVVGERRFRASKIAGLTDVPAIIRQLSDAAALEIMVIENLQREDVHPLDEALGYEALMKKSSDQEAGDLPGAPRHTAESIAAKVGKSVGYVYARLKLLALVPAAREAFEQNYITAGHAVLIARLQPKDQVQGLWSCFGTYLTQYTRDKLNKLDPTAAKLEDVVDFDLNAKADEWGTGNRPRLMAEKGLRDWIQENVNLKLKGVPWDLEDADLVPWAGPCSLCPKRSMSNPALFAELTKKGEDDTCFDPQCFHDKQEAFVKLQVKTEKQAGSLVQISEQTAYTKPKEGEKVLKQGHWLPAKVGECESVQKALIVRGENAGEHKVVCTDLNCKVHKRHLQSAPTSFRPETDPATTAKRDAEAEVRQRVNERLIVGILKAAVKQLGKPDVKTVLALEGLARECFYGMEDLSCAVFGLKSQKEFEAFRKKANIQQAMGLLLLGIMGDNDYLEAPAMKLAIRLGKVDVPKLRKEIEAAQTPAKPVKPAKVKAKKGKKGKK